MAYIELNGKHGRGLYALVDDEDYEYLSQFRWHLTANGYAKQSSPRGDGGKQHAIWMHREILEAPPNMDIDHINHNKLDNRKANLRVASRSENQMNRGGQINNTSGYKGVTRNGRGWMAQIIVRGERIYLGYFQDPEGAAQAYDDAARYYHGKFAYCNFRE